MHARHLALLRWRRERQLRHPDGRTRRWHDPVMAGAGGCGEQSIWIPGSGWCSGEGGWVVGADGRIEKRKGAQRASRGNSSPQR